MENVIVEALVSSLIKSVYEILEREINLILNARDQLESFQGELRFIHEFLRNSAGKRDKVKEVVKQIQEVAIEAQELIDDFVVNMARHQRRSTLQKFWHAGEHMKLLRKVSAKIGRIHNKINLIYENSDKYKITSNYSAVISSTEESEETSIQRRRRNVEENEVVGFIEEAQLVLEKLDMGDAHTDVVSITGMGGTGKSTLAKKVFKCSIDQKGSFDCGVWVDVSQDYNLRNLLLKIAHSVFSSEEMKETKEMIEATLVLKLAARLAQKRYLIVLDDVWKPQLWDEIKAAFPDNGKKSRVLITSRVNDVASHASVPSQRYAMPFLNIDDSWRLFSKKVFRDEVCPPELEELVRQKILSKCKGLPLAIVLVAGLLRNREESMWPQVASGLKWYFDHYPKECQAILALSYFDLPPHLKPCFLFFGVYPEDFDIPVRQLIRLWVAEGFVDQETDNDLEMEDMAEEYLSQLIDRSLVQVASRRTNGGVKSCRIHDLLRDLAISEGKCENFLVVDTKADSSLLSANKPIRRLSIHYGSRDIRYNYFTKIPRLRSLLSFGVKDNCITNKLARDKDPFNRLQKFCRYLRVLDLGSGRCYNFPSKVEKLVQLRYLRMNVADCYEITPPISKLLNLQTLDVQDSCAWKFKANLCEMQQLRHLLLAHDMSAKFHIPKGNDHIVLDNLRTLSSLDLNEKGDVKILKMFPKLKKLKVSVSPSNDDLGVFECLGILRFLQTLKIKGGFRLTDPTKLPESLTKITLFDTKLATSAFSQLGRIQNLQVLKLLSNSLEGSKLECDSNDQGLFPRLKVLHIDYLDIKCWSMKGQGLQSLVYLSIENCFKLKAIPDQLKQLSSLRQLKVASCPLLKESLREIWVSDPTFEYIY